MQATSKSDLLDGIDHLIQVFTPAVAIEDGDGLVFDRQAVETMRKRLHMLRHLAFLNERELGALRLIEAGRIGRSFVEELAAGEGGKLVTDPEGKIVRPDFGRRS